MWSSRLGDRHHPSQYEYSPFFSAIQQLPRVGARRAGLVRCVLRSSRDGIHGPHGMAIHARSNMLLSYRLCPAHVPKICWGRPLPCLNKTRTPEIVLQTCSGVLASTLFLVSVSFRGEIKEQRTKRYYLHNGRCLLVFRFVYLSRPGPGLHVPQEAILAPRGGSSPDEF